MNTLQLVRTATTMFRKMDMSSVTTPHNNTLVAVCQLNCKSDKGANLTRTASFINRAKSRGAEMVFLPECFDYVGESREQSLEMAEAQDGPTIKKYQELAKRNSIWLSLGGMHEMSEDPSKLYNTHLVINDVGDIESTYRKTHLFDVDIPGKVKLKETDFTIPGRQIGPPVETPAGKLGVLTCYDVRFPEASIALSHQGAQILTYPSAFTQSTGMAHWEVLLRSRAIENQCYVIAAAQTGKHNDKRTSYGHAMVVDPWGTVVAQCQEGESVCFAQIDLSYLETVRQGMPVYSHRRPDLYGTIQTDQDKGSLNIDEHENYSFGQHTVSSSCVFYKSALSIGLVNRKPVLPGHVLVLPIRPARRYEDLTVAETVDLSLSVQRIGKVVEKQYEGHALTICVQDGEKAGQSVEHVHFHILPRKGGEFSENDDIYEKLEKHDKNPDGTEIAENDTKWRTVEDMAKEAARLRPLFSN